MDLNQAAAELGAEIERVKKLSTFSKLDALPDLVDRQMALNRLLIAELTRLAGRENTVAEPAAIRT